MKKIVAYIVTTLLLTACGEKLPNEEMALEKLNKNFSNNPKALYKYEDLKKTNGLKMDQMGVEVYQMDYKVNLVALQDIHRYDNSSFAADTSQFYINKGTKMKSLAGHDMIWKYEFHEGYKKGAIIRVDSGKITFMKKENGWE